MILNHKAIFFRYRCVEKYLEYLNNIKDSKEWIIYLNLIDNPKTDKYIKFIILFALINPKNFENDVLINEELMKKFKKEIQGNSFYPRKYIDESSKCDSEKFWGTECRTNCKEMHLDHIFPYSLGGPTARRSNMTPLCASHNMMKSTNIYCYHWEIAYKEYKHCLTNQKSFWAHEQAKRIRHVLNL